jgi:hypothetical protein
MMEDGTNLPARSAVPMGLMTVRQYPAALKRRAISGLSRWERQVVDNEPSSIPRGAGMGSLNG